MDRLSQLCVFRTMWRPALLLSALATGGVLGCQQDPPPDEGILSCDGTCSCDVETNTCSCSGGTECVVEGGEGFGVSCEGNARCDIICEEACDVSCGGTTGCDAHLADGSTAICFGTGTCGFTCEGSCTADCSGAASCWLRCPDDGDCEITGCPSVTECEDGTLACQTACPEPES